MKLEELKVLREGPHPFLFLHRLEDFNEHRL